jgi:hypothetical protein
MEEMKMLYSPSPMLQVLDLFVVGEALWKKEVATKSTLLASER